MINFVCVYRSNHLPDAQNKWETQVLYHDMLNNLYVFLLLYYFPQWYDD